MNYTYKNIQKHSPKWLVEETYAVAHTQFLVQYCRYKGLPYKEGVMIYTNNISRFKREITSQLEHGVAVVEHRKDFLGNVVISVTFDMTDLSI